MSTRQINYSIFGDFEMIGIGQWLYLLGRITTTCPFCTSKINCFDNWITTFLLSEFWENIAYIAIIKCVCIYIYYTHSVIYLLHAISMNKLLTFKIPIFLLIIIHIFQLKTQLDPRELVHYRPIWNFPFLPKILGKGTILFPFRKKWH